MTGNIAERIPGLSDKELAAFHANAQRLKLSGTPAQQAQAEALLPALDAALAERREARTQALQETRKAATTRRAPSAKSPSKRSRAKDA